MTVKTVDLADFAEELGKFSTLSISKKKKAVVRGIAKSMPDLVAASPVDTGLYAQSWDMSIQEQSVIIGNYAPYAGVIEFGARPHKTPIGPLLAWAKRVLGDKSQPESGYSKHVWALALHVQKKIEAEGQLPKHIMEKMIPKIIENIKEELKLV